MKIIVSNKIHLHGALLALARQLEQHFTVDNPAFVSAEKMGRYTGDHEPTLRFCTVDNGVLILPRGAVDFVHGRALAFSSVEAIDNRLTLPEIDLTFRGSLRAYQQQACEDATKAGHSVIEAGTGSGKSVIALAIIAARSQPTLIIVHTKELLHQWRERIEQFLGVEAGLIGDGQFDVRPVTVAIVNTARNRLDELVDRFGHVVVDECHRVPATLFTETVTAFPARYLLGLSATPYRRDGLDNLIGWFVGENRVRVDMKILQQVGAVLRPKVIERETDFAYCYLDDYQDMITALVENPHRNESIAADIRQQSERGRTTLVVSDRVGHLRRISELAAVGGARLLTGKTPKRERLAIVADLNAGKVPVLYSTLSLIGEGFDCPGLDTLLIASPIRYSGRLKQVVGRVMRPADGKQPVVIDYVDSRVGLLEHQAKARRRVYLELKAA